MEVLITILVLTGILVIFYVRGMIDERRMAARKRREIHDSYGQLRTKEYSAEEWESISGYFRYHCLSRQNLADDSDKKVLDDITWNDLNMDAVFARINHTWSSAGQEYLYYRLRTPWNVPEDGEQQEQDRQQDIITWFSEHEKEREELFFAFSRLGRSGKYSLYDYLMYLEESRQQGNFQSIAADILFVICIFLIPFRTEVALSGLFLLLTFQMLAYSRQKQKIEPYLDSLAYAKRMLDFSREIRKVQIPVLEEEWNRLSQLEKRFGKFRFAFLLGMSGNSMAGDPLSVLMDYVNMIFHLDLILSRTMLAEIKKKLTQLDRMVTILGKTEMELSIASVRASMTEGWCVPVLEPVCGKVPAETTLGGMHLRELYHILLLPTEKDETSESSRVVTNEIHTSRGVLITGSNASGKSTFLKAVAVNAILAQTIGTAAAAEYRAPRFRIYSSMALHDNLQGGESYYMVEIRALKRILDAAAQPAEEKLPLLCLVDEVLRGTNTVERIAASTQILRSLDRPDVFCFAATHDIELTELLQEHYDNYHFEETIENDDIFFDYKLRPGKAETRNAIRLLGLMGYDDKMIREANKMAEEYLKTGIWREKQA